MPDLLDDIALDFLAPGRGGPAVRSSGDDILVMEYDRDLTPQDIVIINTVPTGTKMKPVQQLRYSHHMLARLIASGKSITESAIITGHSRNRAYMLSEQDPAFRELVAHYKEQHNQQFLDAAGRLAMLGTTAVEIMQERLEDNPEKIAMRELKEIVEMAFDRSVAPSKGAAKGAGSAASGVTVNVSFVSPKAPTSEPPVIDVVATPQLEQK